MPETRPTKDQILKIALPVPLPQLFDYLPPANLDHALYVPGQRFSVPFGNRELIGILVSIEAASETAKDKLKEATSLLETKPCLPEELIKLCQWSANYYHHPVGEVLSSALPLRYRKPEAREEICSLVWVHTTEGLGLPDDALKRSKKQQILHQHLLQHQFASEADCKRLNISPAVCKALADKGLIKQRLNDLHVEVNTQVLAAPPLELNQEQNHAISAIRYHQFQCNLLHGVTGSGKTEVYMQIITRVLQTGKQALVLIPEIGLTPQTLQRFHQRFQVEIAELHSRVSEVERARNWEKARAGVARIILGTRLAALTPVKDLGVIIVDEEHDSSYKQNDGFRYSARDLSIYRAHQLQVPIILGSATPSLESLNHALNQRYQHLILKDRAGNSQPPLMQALDMRQQELKSGLTNTALSEIKQTLDKGKQALVFINRRGYAPLLYCQSCGWHARCPSCDMNFTLHQSPPRLHCHHCDCRRGIPTSCPGCQNTQLQHSGAGTEQVVEYLQTYFRDVAVTRIDRDTTRNKDSMEKLLAEASKGKPCILVGTQMLAKGHHLKSLDLVVVLDTDQGLMSPDYKALERLGQLITQVAGRAGREQDLGKVLLQSFQPEHPLLQTLIHSGYEAFASTLLQSRKAAGLPPFSYSALFRAESKRGENAVELLQLIKRELNKQKTHFANTNSLRVLGPFPAVIEKLNHRYRYQLQVYCNDRPLLHQLLDRCMEATHKNALSRRTRWSLDIDPVDHI